MTGGSRVLSVLCLDPTGTLAAHLGRADATLAVTARERVADALDYLDAHAVDCVVVAGSDAAAAADRVRERAADVPVLAVRERDGAVTVEETYGPERSQSRFPTGEYARLADRIRTLVALARDRRSVRENRYRAAFEKAFDAIVIADDDGRYLEANESACDLFALPREELVGRRISAFLPDDVDFGEEWLAFGDEPEKRGTLPFVDANGDEHAVEYAAVRDIVPGEHLSVIRDVTDRERRDAELRDRQQRLEEFTSVVSHDIRSPLQVVAGRLDFARERHPDDPDLDSARTSLGRAFEIIENLLALARNGDDIADTEPVDLETVVERAWRNVATGDAVLTVESTATLHADPTRLQQLLENLLKNCVEHAGAGVAVTVGASADGFFVADDGPGVPAAVREGVRGSVPSTSHGGSGFGLRIVAAIADAHGWTFDIADRDGGARFEFRGVDAGNLRPDRHHHT
ncbi:sensor histidine kinase [Salarchaeum japonicum]|uniref:histidine kinase n=1 Tax=Salarchaeum japonicum TaxID=555573 RepID=A0AAV3T397_9EURY|nr:PAS domain-containing sensor histidine kinase [Salarchaeum japonicum]